MVPKRKRRARLAALGWVVALGLPPASAWAQQTLPTLSEFVACLKLPDGAKLEYPAEAFERRDGGTVQLELIFSRADEAPTVRVLNRPRAWERLVDATLLHVRRFRMPCLPDGHPPVTLHQDYVFTPNDGRKVVATAPTESDPARQRQLACMTLTGQPGPVDYPLRSQRLEEQGTVILELNFTHAERPPEIRVLARPRSADLVAAVREYAQRLRLPCLESASIRTNLSYRFKFEGAPRALINDIGLVPLLKQAKDVRGGVYFDLNTMACPFDLRITYWRPHLANTVGQLDRDVPERRPLMDWLANIELDVRNVDTANLLLGAEFTLRVPCGTIDL
jgi:hypothetical protein